MKRLFDLFVSSMLLILLLPVIGFVAWQIRNKLGLPIFFRQVRPGLFGEPFVLIKFRSMLDEVDDSGLILSASERLTPFGKFLRSTSLDELPELWNVLKGDMSLVGPRPLMTEYLPLYSARQTRRHEVLPGITGWAQVNGRNAISWEEKFELDVCYVENKSFFLDLKILLLTFYKVLLRKNINSSENISMPKFTGS